MKALVMSLALLIAATCGGQPPASLGDSPIKEVRCPSFIGRSGCLERARRTCGTERITVIGSMPDVDVIGRGTTVPIEGTIKHWIVTVRCEYE